MSTEQGTAMAEPQAKGWRPAVAWAMFDWANSPYPTIVMTFVFGTYFTKAIAETPEVGTAQWGWAMALAGFIIAVLGPFTGAAADRMGRRKPWLGGFSALCIAASALLWFAAPVPESTLLALTLVVVGTVGFEMTMVFYNAMLPDVAPQGMMGRLSGWAWGLGYAGGLAALILSLVVFVQNETPPFGLDRDAAEHVRITPVLVAVWFAVFCIPTFVMVREPARGAPVGAALRHAVGDVMRLWQIFRTYPVLGRFLVARMIYTDGLNTLFAFGGIYAAGTFGLPLDQVIMLGIAMNITAGLGAAAFGWMDDRLGARATIAAGVLGLIVLGGGLLIVESTLMFWALALPMGLFFGPVQSASRSMVARLAPPELTTEMFGLYALSGKITAFAGPLLLGWATLLADSQRAGMATVLVFLVGGLFLLLWGVPSRAENPFVTSCCGADANPPGRH